MVPSPPGVNETETGTGTVISRDLDIPDLGPGHPNDPDRQNDNVADPLELSCCSVYHNSINNTSFIVIRILWIMYSVYLFLNKGKQQHK